MAQKKKAEKKEVKPKSKPKAAKIVAAVPEITAEEKVAIVEAVEQIGADIGRVASMVSRYLPWRKRRS